MCSGERLSIKATGNFKQEVDEGFTMHLQVKYGLITLINQNADGCDTIKKGDLDCPLEKGEMSLTKDVDLPREIPPVRRTSLSRRLRHDANSATGPVHGSRRCPYREWRQDYLPHGLDRIPPVNVFKSSSTPHHTTKTTVSDFNNAGEAWRRRMPRAGVR